MLNGRRLWMACSGLSATKLAPRSSATQSITSQQIAEIAAAPVAPRAHAVQADGDSRRAAAAAQVRVAQARSGVTM